MSIVRILLLRERIIASMSPLELAELERLGVARKTLFLPPSRPVETRSPRPFTSGGFRALFSPVEITGNHVEAVHSAARDAEQEAKGAPAGSGRHAAALEQATLLREVQAYLLGLVPESERATYLRFIPAYLREQLKG